MFMKTTKRTDCPKCGRKNTYTEVEENGFRMWNCYVASCSNRGAKRVGLINNSSITTAIPKKIKPTVADIRRDTIPVHSSKKSLDYLEKYLLTDFIRSTLGDMSKAIRYNQQIETIVFLCGNIAVGRYIGTESRPKWLLLTDLHNTMLFHTTRQEITHDKRLLIVEDTISAAVASTHLTNINGCMALLGTKFTEKHLTDCIKYDKLYIALDKDALGNAIKLVDKLKLIKKCQLISLDKDIKEMNEQELIELDRRFK